MGLILLIFFPHQAWQVAFKNIKVKLHRLSDIGMLLMVEKGIRGGICHNIYRYPKANWKCMKDYDTNKEWSYLKYWDVNNFYGWGMLQNLPLNKFEWFDYTSQFNGGFIKNYNEESVEEYFFDVKYPEHVYNLNNNLSFSIKRMETEKFKKLAANLYNKTEKWCS